MDQTGFFSSLEQTGIAMWMRDSLYALPIVNSFHVVALALVFGTILIVDLRLLGLPSTSQSFLSLAGDTLKWSWMAFGLALVTGLLMFAANATTFVSNDEFLLKMLLIALAGINMLVFHFRTLRTVHLWDRNAPAPAAAKAAGAISILLWLGVIILGRWIGYTKGFDFTIPADMDFDFL